MNLTTDPWIPIVTASGEVRDVSLCDVFQSGATFTDLAVRPHERISLMRLLICISQAAIDGPTANADRESAFASLPSKAGDYLKKWKASFELFDRAHPFLQLANLEKPPKPLAKAKTKKNSASTEEGETEEGTAASKLDFALSTGNNTTLFDNSAARQESRTFTSAQLARMLITFQCFSPGGRIGIAQWNGVDTPGKGSSGHAPCAPGAMLHSFVREENLLSTIQANLLTRALINSNYRKPWGKPVWEMPPASFEDSGAIENATTTYLGRLMPLARAILLREDGKSLLLANGLDYPSIPEFSTEPTATTVVKKDKSGLALVGAGNRALWRELPALVIKRADNTGGPLTLSEADDERATDLWVGALITDKASIIDTVEGVYHLPARLRNEPGRLVFEAEVSQSESASYALGSAAKVYRSSLELKPQGYPEKAFALRHYWTSVEQSLPLLNAYISAPDGSDEGEAARRTWRSAIWRAARDAYHLACPFGTPRQRRAHALGLRTLYRPSKNTTSPVSETV